MHNVSLLNISENDQSRKNIVLVGFMGAGKTTVGRLLATILGYNFIDIDAYIVASTQKSIEDIFKESGEVGFRAYERAAVREAMAQPGPWVVATGGGTYLDASARHMIARVAQTIFLRARLPTLLQRLEKNPSLQTRPLLHGHYADAVAVRLLEQRTPIYEQADYVVDTDDCSAEDVVQDILRTCCMHHINTPNTILAIAEKQLRVVSHAGAYPVMMHIDAGHWLVDHIVQTFPTGRLAIISDTNVVPLYADHLLLQLRHLNRQVSLHSFAAGEDAKVIATAAALYDELMDAGIARSDALLALGGGVVGDMTGFVASTYMRGIAYMQIPTTTLAAIDASVGGKTAVNTRRGKNLVGTFYPPRAVCITLEYLKTQERRAHAAGLVEALKIGATHDANLFFEIIRQAWLLLGYEKNALLDIIHRAITLKAAVVTADEYDNQARLALNFGHTIGHAIEVGEGFRLLHGECVALGMMAELHFAQHAGLCGQEMIETLEKALHALNLPTHWQQTKIDVQALAYDKKRLDGGAVCMPIVAQLGTFVLHQVPVSALQDFVKASIKT